VTFEATTQRSSLSVIDVDVSVVAACQDLVGIELKTGDYVTLMCTKCDVPWLRVLIHPTLSDKMMSLIEGFEEMHVA
jgi:hypothetical protein